MPNLFHVSYLGNFLLILPTYLIPILINTYIICKGASTFQSTNVNRQSVDAAYRLKINYLIIPIFKEIILNNN